MKISILQLLYQTPALYWFGKHLSSRALLATCRYTVGLSLLLNPHTRRYLRPLKSVLESQLDQNRLREVETQFLVYRRYNDNLPFVWRRQKHQVRNFFAVHGEEHIKAALSIGKGAIIVSGHRFGINRMIPPVLAQLGYAISRVGAWEKEEMGYFWGNEGQRPWKKIYLGSDLWSRIRAARQISSALATNHLVLMSVSFKPTGSSEVEVRAFGQTFYLDPSILQLFAHLDAPVLPCFALCDDHGRIQINVHPALTGSDEDMSRTYCRHFSTYLQEHPEFCRFWRALVQKRSGW